MSKNSLYLMNFNNHAILSHQYYFKIKKEQAKREGYDKTHVRGVVMYDDNFNGCPHCGAKNFYICNRCGKVVCYHGQEVVTCPNCGSSSTLQAAESVDLSGGGF